MSKKVLILFSLIWLIIRTEAQQRFLLYNVQIIDVKTGKLMKPNAVYIQNGKIAAVGSTTSLKNKYSLVPAFNGQSKYLIPGLWDMHVHLEGAELIKDNEALLPVFLAYGITTIRDCASDLGLQVLKWRDEIAAGRLVGPTIYTAGRKLEGKNSIWKGDLEIANETELKTMLDTLDRDKVDFIKITENTLHGDLFLASVKAAHSRGYNVSGHVPLDLTIEELVDAGYTSVEHASYLLRLGANEKGIAAALRSEGITKGAADSIYNVSFNQAKATSEYQKLAKKGLFVCPTLIGAYQLAYLKETDHSKDSFLQFLTKKFVSNYEWRIQRMAGETPEQLKQRRDRLELLKRQLPIMASSGITLMAGSDAAALNTYVYPAESIIRELEIFQEAGLKPAQILQSATIAGARYFKVENRTATIEVGKDADMVLLDANPLEDATNLRKVYTVIKKGNVYDRKRLNAMLEQAKSTKQSLDQARAPQ